LLTILVFATVFGILRSRETSFSIGPLQPPPTVTTTNRAGTNSVFPMDKQGRRWVGFDKLGGFELNLTVLTNAKRKVSDLCSSHAALPPKRRLACFVSPHQRHTQLNGQLPILPR
tara:strand:- start:26039 stop:26383 length:345 start_codon:yes stop_codon:yes gene_type:complete